jgi:hypothetical protein
MANTTYATHATVQTDGGNDFLHYVTDGGGQLFTVDQNGAVVAAGGKFAINSSGNISTIGGVASVGIGSPVLVYALSTTLGYAVFNSAAAVNMLPTTAPTGTYRISLYMVPTTGFATSTEEVITFGWSDDDTAQTKAFTSSAQSAGTITTGSQIIRSVTGTAVTYTPSVTGSNATAGVMAISIVVERLI